MKIHYDISLDNKPHMIDKFVSILKGKLKLFIGSSEITRAEYWSE